MTHALTIGWLYPTLMNTYGDRGNIITLTKRCQWREIDIEIEQLNPGFTVENLKKCHLLFMGGAQDRQQQIVSDDFYPINGAKAKMLHTMIENETPGLYICGAYQFLGKYYKQADQTSIAGLSILDLYTENPGENYKRLTGNIAMQSTTMQNESGIETVVGFENHGGRTYLGKNVQPFGKVLVGFGNNGKDKTEGAVYKNSFGTYLHGPILPKNPHLADYLIQKALEKKYNEPFFLSPLDDALEWQSHDEVLKKLQIPQ